MANDLIYYFHFFGDSRETNERVALAVAEALGKSADAVTILNDETTAFLSWDGYAGRYRPYHIVWEVIERNPEVRVLGSVFELQNGILGAFMIDERGIGHAALLGTPNWPTRRGLRGAINGLGDVPARLVALMVEDAMAIFRDAYRPYLGSVGDLPHVLLHVLVLLVCWPCWLPGFFRVAMRLTPMDTDHEPELVLLATGGLSERQARIGSPYGRARNAFDVNVGELAAWRPDWPVTPLGVGMVAISCIAHVLMHIGELVLSPVVRLVGSVRGKLQRRLNVEQSVDTSPEISF